MCQKTLTLCLACILCAVGAFPLMAQTMCPGVSLPWGGSGVTQVSDKIESFFFVDCNATIEELVVDDPFISQWYRELQYNEIANCVNQVAQIQFPTPPNLACRPKCAAPYQGPCFHGVRDRFFVTGLVWGPYSPSTPGERHGGCMVDIVQLTTGLCKLTVKCTLACATDVQREAVCGCATLNQESSLQFDKSIGDPTNPHGGGQ